MCAADKPSNLPGGSSASNDGIVHDGAKQRAWRAAKLREAIDNQTPSEIMEARTGTSVPRFGIDGLDEPESTRSVKKSSRAKSRSAMRNRDVATSSRVLRHPPHSLNGILKDFLKPLANRYFCCQSKGLFSPKHSLQKNSELRLRPWQP
jgi:hypothetical protein